MPRTILAASAAAFLTAMLAATAVAAPRGGQTFTDPAAADADFPFQGEYAGVVKYDSGEAAFGVQVIACGEGTFDAVAYPGGLPGAGWTPPDTIRGTGVRDGDVVRLKGVDLGGATRRGEIRGGSLVVLDEGGDTIATLPRVNRASPTLGATPPAGANRARSHSCGNFPRLRSSREPSPYRP